MVSRHAATVLVVCLLAQTAWARPVTIEDSIELRQFGSEPGSSDKLVQISPDGSHAATILRAANLKTRKVDYSILLVRTPGASKPPAAPRVLLTLSSDKNQPAITNLRWAEGGRSLVFLGEGTRGNHQITVLDLASGKRRAVTPESVDVTNFDCTQDLARCAYFPRPMPDPEIAESVRQAGIRIDRQQYSELVTGRRAGARKFPPVEVVIVQDGVSRTLKLPMLPDSPSFLSLSPSGTSLLLLEILGRQNVPAHWAAYGDPMRAANLWVLDIASGKGRRLLDAPTYDYAPVVWADDASVLLPASHLPVAGDAGTRIETDQFALAVDVKRGTYTEIARGRWRILDWDAARQRLTLEAGSAQPQSYKRTGGRWIPVDAPSAAADAVVVEEGLNLPPRLVWKAAGGHTQLLFDPNPNLSQLDLGEARNVEFALRDGKKINVGLFLPSDWSAGAQYPIVIQTHGWNPTKFTLDGHISTSGYAARVLASYGIIVVQMPDLHRIYPDALTSRTEGPRNAAVFEDLVDELARLYGGDRSRVGLQGFSRTGMAVRYALGNSRQAYAAAALIDTMFIGYTPFLTAENVEPSGFQETMTRIVGAEPFGEGLKEWVERSAGFTLARIKTPELVMQFGHLLHSGTWEEFVGLRHLEKPAEFVYFPDATHSPVRPLERKSVQHRVVDWFRFWLQDAQDPDPAKFEQYQRWQALRRQRDETANVAGRS
jgi:dipeptidyl aminopeptidase/acylaminoacyl peptidase